MAQSKDTCTVLDLVVQPAFCVKKGIITAANPAALGCMVRPGDSVDHLLYTGQAEYAEFTGGCLYLMLKIAGQLRGASVTKTDDGDVFLLEQENNQTELQAMALAATELRKPLSAVMTIADDLIRNADQQQRAQFSKLTRGLYQMLRISYNMSDAGHYSAALPPTELQNITAVFSEIFSSAEGLVRQASLSLKFTNLSQDVFCLADKEKLERAILNMLSNAIKFTPAGGIIEAKLTKKGNLLVLSVQDNGEGIGEGIQGSIYHRYRRPPGIEDGRFGIGLGMVLIRAVAAQHGGTLLLDQPGDRGTRITMTLAIRQRRDGNVSSPIFQVDYTGGRDHKLIELADCLPAALYDPKSE